MPINRFDKPGVYDFDMDYYVPKEFIPDFEAFDELLGNLQMEKDATELAAEKIPLHLDKDKENVNKFVARRAEAMGNITDMYMNNKISDARRAQGTMLRDIRRDFLPGGEGAAYENNYNAWQAYRKAIMEDDTINSAKKDALLAKSMEAFEGTLDPAGGYRTINTMTAQADQDLDKYADESAKGWKENATQSGLKQDAYGWYRTDTHEYVDDEEILNHIAQAMVNDPNIMADVAQRQKLFGEDPEKLITDAASKAAAKYGFSKTSRKWVANWKQRQDYKQHLKDKENTIAAVEGSTEGIQYNMLWEGSEEGIKDYVDNNTKAAEAEMIELLNGATNMSSAQRKEATEVLTPEDFASNKWHYKLGFDTAEDAAKTYGWDMSSIQKLGNTAKKTQHMNAPALQQVKDAKESADSKYKLSAEEEKSREERNILLMDLNDSYQPSLGGDLLPREDLIKALENDQVVLSQNSPVMTINGERYDVGVKERAAIEKYMQHDEDFGWLVDQRQKYIDEYLEKAGTKKVATRTTTDVISDTDPASQKANTVALKEHFGSPGDGIEMYLSGKITKPMPASEIFKLSTEKPVLDGPIRITKTPMMNGERMFVLNYKWKDAGGAPRTTQVFSPIRDGEGGTMTAELRKTLYPPERKAADAISYANLYNISSGNPLIDLDRQVKVYNNGNVRIWEEGYPNGKLYTDETVARRKLEREYNLQYIIDTYPSIKTPEEAEAFIETMLGEQ